MRNCSVAMMAKPSGPFTIKSGVKQGCVLAPHSLEFSSRCCGLLPSNGLKMAFASIPEPMEILSILHVSEFSLIQRLGEFSLGRYCSPLQHHTSCFANACTKFGLTPRGGGGGGTRLSNGRGVPLGGWKPDPVLNRSAHEKYTLS